MSQFAANGIYEPQGGGHVMNVPVVNRSETVTLTAVASTSPPFRVGRHTTIANESGGQIVITWYQRNPDTGTVLLRSDISSTTTIADDRIAAVPDSLFGMDAVAVIASGTAEVTIITAD